MRRTEILCFVVAIIITTLFRNVKSQSKDVNIDISLKGKLPTLNNSEVYYELFTLQSSNVARLKITDVAPGIAFLVIQAHAFQYNITLSESPVLESKHHVNGTNLGLVYDKKTPVTYYVYNFNKLQDVEVAVAVHAYLDEAPIPGGCNMEFAVEVSPYLVVDSAPQLRSVSASPAGLVSTQCDDLPKTLLHHFFHYFLPEMDFSSHTYFDGLRKMSTVGGIQQHGRETPVISGYAQMRKFFNLYAGGNSIYAVTATINNVSSVYVPAHAYSCLYSGAECNEPNLIVFYVLLAVLGIVLCFFGMSAYLTCTFVFGWYLGGLISYAIIGNIFPSLSFEATFITCVACGLLFRILTMFVFNFSALAYTMGALCLGVHMAAISYFSLPDGFETLSNDIVFWCLFVSVVLFVFMPISALLHIGHIVVTSLLGSFAVILPVDVLIGSNIRYIVINVLRRMTVEHFNIAVIDPPYQWRDIATTAVWALLFLVGAFLQYRRIKYDPERVPLIGPPRMSRTRMRFYF